MMLSWCHHTAPASEYTMHYVLLRSQVREGGIRDRMRVEEGWAEKHRQEASKADYADMRGMGQGEKDLMILLQK